MSVMTYDRVYDELVAVRERLRRVRDAAEGLEEVRYARPFLELALAWLDTQLRHPSATQSSTRRAE